MRRPALYEILCMIILIVVGILSVTVLNGLISSPEFYSGTIGVLEEQKTEALTLSVAVTAGSTALSALPDDMASPIASELANLSTPLFAIVAVIYLEIFLLTTFGWIAATVLIPGICALLIAFILFRKEFLLIWIKRIAILAIAMMLLIPTSAKITAQIEDTFSEMVDQKMHAASHIANAAESEEEDENAILSFFAGLADNVASLVEAARNMLSTLVDAVAVLLITSCVIPVITLIVFLQVIKIALNVDIPSRKLALLVQPTKKEAKAIKSPEEAKE